VSTEPKSSFEARFSDNFVRDPASGPMPGDYVSDISALEPEQKKVAWELLDREEWAELEQLLEAHGLTSFKRMR
jgi:hypothetical protein